MDTPTDDQILERAREIKERTGVTLSEAMFVAEKELSPKPAIPETFEIELNVKPKVSRWIIETFQPTKTHTREQRLAAFISQMLNRTRVSALRAMEQGEDIQEGRAVTLSRSQFAAKAPQ